MPGETVSNMAQNGDTNSDPALAAAKPASEALRDRKPDTFEESPAKRIKLNEPSTADSVKPAENSSIDRKKGTAQIKPECVRACIFQILFALYSYFPNLVILTYANLNPWGLKQISNSPRPRCERTTER